MYGNNMEFRGGPRRNFAPVKVGDELDIKIEAVGEKGDGIAKKDGFVLFVPNTKVNDEVKIRITRVLRKVGFAEVVGSGSSNSESSDSEKSEDEGYPAEETEQSEEETNQSEDSQDSEDFGEEDN